MSKSNGSMNRVYRVVWNAVKKVFQAVAEHSRGRGKSKSEKTSTGLGPWLSAGAFVLASTAWLGVAQANTLPQGGNVVAGTGSIAQQGSTLVVQQDTARMAVDWQSFSVGQGNTVQFVQPSASAVALNRVLGSDVSVIQGAINANGQVFLINPNGVLFSSTAHVNVGALVASTLNISNADFMAGNYTFEGASSNAIVNQGNIQAAEGGYVVLIAAKIENVGSLNAHKGSVLLGAGARVRLDLGGPVKLEVEQGAIDALIQSGGAIKADGGVVLLTAKAAGDLASTVINHTGLIEAQTLVAGKKGEITLLGEGGEVKVSGKLDASADGSGQGGRIVATGKYVLIDEGAHLNADGAHGGGEVLVGGSWQNSDSSVHQATGTAIAPGALLSANATDKGDGGTVVAWSDIKNPESVTKAYGSFEADGGPNGGNGGRIETSGYYLEAEPANISLAAPLGAVGTWLLDPWDIYIHATDTIPNGASWNNQTLNTYSNTSATGDSYVAAATVNYYLGLSNVQIMSTRHI
jgi:filamentous hemagglutinin family protein